MRQALGLPAPEERIGDAAHIFTSLLGVEPSLSHARRQDRRRADSALALAAAAAGPAGRVVGHARAGRPAVARLGARAQRAGRPGEARARARAQARAGAQAAPAQRHHHRALDRQPLRRVRRAHPGARGAARRSAGRPTRRCAARSCTTRSAASRSASRTGCRRTSAPSSSPSPRRGWRSSPARRASRPSGRRASTASPNGSPTPSARGAPACTRRWPRWRAPSCCQAPPAPSRSRPGPTASTSATAASSSPTTRPATSRTLAGRAEQGRAPQLPAGGGDRHRRRVHGARGARGHGPALHLRLRRRAAGPGVPARRDDVAQLAREARDGLVRLIADFDDAATPYRALRRAQLQLPLRRLRPSRPRGGMVGRDDRGGAEMGIFFASKAEKERDARLTETQRSQAAAADPSASAWVSANAGTGKTHVLTMRVLRLLLGGTPPERILALTYTKAAAAEMSKRVFARLAEWVTADEASLKRKLAELLDRAPTLGRDAVGTAAVRHRHRDARRPQGADHPRLLRAAAAAVSARGRRAAGLRHPRRARARRAARAGDRRDARRGHGREDGARCGRRCRRPSPMPSTTGSTASCSRPWPSSAARSARTTKTRSPPSRRGCARPSACAPASPARTSSPSCPRRCAEELLPMLASALRAGSKRDQDQARMPAIGHRRRLAQPPRRGARGLLPHPGQGTAQATSPRRRWRTPVAISSSSRKARRRGSSPCTASTRG